MTRRIARGGVCVIVALLFATAAFADSETTPASPTCPGNITNPLQILVGNWGFQLHGTGLVNRRTVSDNSELMEILSSLLDGQTYNQAAVGWFSATIAPGTRAPNTLQGSVKTTLSTVNTNGTNNPIIGSEAGLYTIEPDCTGGTIMLSDGTSGIGFRTLRFIFVNNFTEMYLVNADNNGAVVYGTAKQLKGAQTKPEE